MANYFLLKLDTTNPANPNLIIEGGNQYATQQIANLAISTTDTPTTGYQMKIWGAVDGSYDAAVQPLEENSTWITYATAKQIRLSAGDGSKSISIKIRDNVWNESSIVSKSIILDTSLPVANVSGPDVNVISKNAGKNECSFSFTGSENFTEYKIKIVGSTGAAHDTGTLIPTAGGSTGISATGSWTNASVINAKITGADLEAAGAQSGVDSIIKIFIKDSSGTWSA